MDCQSASSEGLRVQKQALTEVTTRMEDITPIIHTLQVEKDLADRVGCTR
jgi:hypothetical protein